MKTTNMIARTRSKFPADHNKGVPTTDQAPRNPSEDDEIERAKERQREKELREGSQEPA